MEIKYGRELSPEEVEQYKLKYLKTKKQAKIARKKAIINSEGDIKSYLYGLGVDSTDRFDAFLDLVPRLHHRPDLFWYGLGIGYTSSDNTYAWREYVKRCFNSSRPNRDALMNEKEKELLQALPAMVKIYRGMTV